MAPRSCTRTSRKSVRYISSTLVFLVHLISVYISRNSTSRQKTDKLTNCLLYIHLNSSIYLNNLSTTLSIYLSVSSIHLWLDDVRAVWAVLGADTLAVEAVVIVLLVACQSRKYETCATMLQNLKTWKRYFYMVKLMKPKLLGHIHLNIKAVHKVRT